MAHPQQRLNLPKAVNPLIPTVPRVVVTPNHKITLLLLQNYNFAVMNCNVDI